MRTVERRVCQVNRRHVDGTWEFEFSGVHDYLLRLSMCFQVTTRKFDKFGMMIQFEVTGLLSVLVLLLLLLTS